MTSMVLSREMWCALRIAGVLPASGGTPVAPVQIVSHASARSCSNLDLHRHYKETSLTPPVPRPNTKHSTPPPVVRSPSIESPSHLAHEPSSRSRRASRNCNMASNRDADLAGSESDDEPFNYEPAVGSDNEDRDDDHNNDNDDEDEVRQSRPGSKKPSRHQSPDDDEGGAADEDEDGGEDEEGGDDEDEDEEDDDDEDEEEVVVSPHYAPLSASSAEYQIG